MLKKDIECQPIVDSIVDEIKKFNDAYAAPSQWPTSYFRQENSAYLENIKLERLAF